VADRQAEQDIVVDVEGLSKRFDIYASDRARVMEVIWGGQRHIEHWALRDVTFQVPRGSAFGVIGPNGAGKSSLLRILSGVSPPTHGRVDLHASLNSLLDLSVGFHGDFSGRENAVLNCRLLGMSEEEIAERIPYIVEFAEIGEFMDLPVRTYSTGMGLRLGFAIAAHLNHEILLIDELLSVGDTYFQRKCIRRIEEFVAEGRTLILVSHDLHAVRELCHEAMWLHKGQIETIGPSRHVVEAYTDRVRSQRLPPAANTTSEHEPRKRRAARGKPLDYRATLPDLGLRKALEGATHLGNAEHLLAREGEEPEGVLQGKPEDPTVSGTGEVEILSVQILDALGNVVETLQSFQPLAVAVTFRTVVPVVDPVMGVAFFRNDGVYVFGPNTAFDGVEELRGVFDGVYTYFIYYPKMSLLEGTYRISVALYDKSHLKPHMWHNKLYEMKVVSEVDDHGLIHMDHHWGLLTHASGERENLA